jgi:outer membrane protein OmpA-like peptidoglycan-associated protein
VTVHAKLLLVVVVISAVIATATSCGSNSSAGTGTVGQVTAEAAGFPWSSADGAPFWIPTPTATERTLVNSATLFDLDSAKISPSGAAEITAGIQAMIGTDTEIRVDAWASADGDGSYNLRLSMARAQAVADMLATTLGFDRERIVVVAHGEDGLPYQPPTDPRNRRVVVTSEPGT